MEKEENFIIKITDKGAVENCHIFSTFLPFLLVLKREGKIKTIDEIKNEGITQLEKGILWLKRPDDKTSTTKDKKEAKKMAEETIKMIEKLWKTAM